MEGSETWLAGFGGKSSIPGQKKKTDWDVVTNSKPDGDRGEMDRGLRPS